MKLTRASSYALQAVTFLAQRKKPGPVASHDIAKARNIPGRFLLKVLTDLVDIKVLESVKGPKGGYKLARPATESEVITGFEVGRYVVTRRLGQGAMGQVFAAYDPRLDRNVAIKLLRADLPMVENKPLRQRLEREAQALARLSHPNVVAVHDLGEHGDELFIAMDLVEGQTLTEWLQGAPRPWAEVQRVFLMAAEGLAAAHVS